MMIPPAQRERVLDEPVADSGATAITLAGVLHLYVAFDWGEQIDLKEARRLVKGSVQALPRRRRTPSSIDYRPKPLRVSLGPVPLELPGLGRIEASGEATVFDFAGISAAFQVPFKLETDALVKLAGFLANPETVIEAARLALAPVHEAIRTAIQAPHWSELSEEYFVFHLSPTEVGPPAMLLARQASWLASLTRLEADPLSHEEIDEALKAHLGYSPEDLFIADWAAAVLIDTACEETLQVVEFANLQLLEFRHIDTRLDDTLASASRLLQPPLRLWVPFWRRHIPTLRLLGEMKVEASGLIERTSNVLKLVGDQYLARIYRLMAARFHLQEWEHNIQQKLEVAEGLYHFVSDEAAHNRTEFLELIVVVLILMELVLALVRH